MRTWIISEVYYPDKTSTAVLLTQLADGLAASHDVAVLTGPPKESNAHLPAMQQIGGVAVYRAFGTRGSQHYLASRALNMITVSAAIGWKALCSFRRGDCAIVVTNPPVLPYLVAIAARLRGAHAILLVHDVYPEVLEVVGIINSRSFAGRMANRLATWLYRQMNAIVVIGRDMRRIVERHLGSSENSLVCIANWTDGEIECLAEPDPALRKRLGLTGKFVIQYSGNMGRTHDLEILFQAAERLRSYPDIHFLFVGGGAQKAWITNKAAKSGLSNVTVADWFPRSELSAALSIGDLGVVSFKPGMSGVSVPSRMYNIFASGRPILAVSEPDSETAIVVAEHKVGFVVSPSDCDTLVDTILSAASDRDNLREMGARARVLAETKYSFEESLRCYEALIDMVSR